ncbi:hypothetical protein EC396_00825 [Lutibacter sp. HS1-25]|uniref:hypothetical protein n=1 Tax=Lutibacter sp. HS1-25 TaxID=2485000 RepID=UPI001010D118|nr:hypothetical protein [Lutibacter sp. HS1-25]RXP64551.1 hypothetical protein EC396_00825 [Lutibacter sp. HS1-25]
MNKKDKIRTEFNEIIKQINSKKYNKWYTLKDLVTIKNISYKSLKNMVKEVYEVYSPQGTIRKEGRRYCIHYSILDAFKLKRPRETTFYSHFWLSNISWATKDYYDKAYHQYLIAQLKLLIPNTNIIETIEQDKSQRYHVHLLADSQPEDIEPIIESLLDFYLDSDKNYRLYCEPVYNTGSSVDYLLKNPQ